MEMWMQMKTNTGKHKINLKMSGFKNGVYFVKISVEESVLIMKIVET